MRCSPSTTGWAPSTRCLRPSRTRWQRSSGRRGAERLGVDPRRIAVGGDSAGGTLGAAVSQATRDGPRPAFQWLIYPGTDCAAGPAPTTCGRGLPAHRAHHRLVPGAPPGGRRPDRRPGLAREGGGPLGLPPAYVATGGFDPLRDEAEEYAARLREAGVPTALQRFSSLPHAFANLTGVSRAAREAMLQAVEPPGLAADDQTPVSRGRTRPVAGETGGRCPISA